MCVCVCVHVCVCMCHLLVGLYHDSVIILDCSIKPCVLCINNDPSHTPVSFIHHGTPFLSKYSSVP